MWNPEILGNPAFLNLSEGTDLGNTGVGLEGKNSSSQPPD